MRRYQLWFIAWAKVFDGVIGVLTLGFIMPSVTFRLADYFVRGMHE